MPFPDSRRGDVLVMRDSIFLSFSLVTGSMDRAHLPHYPRGD